MLHAPAQMTHVDRRLPVGAEAQPEGVHFRVWAPDHSRVSVVIERAGRGPIEQGLTDDGCGYFGGLVSGAAAGDYYWFSIAGERIPDPASRFQPDGPFGPSQVIDPHLFAWTDAGWNGIGLRGQVVYEMHCGTFTAEGTWRAAMTRLPHLVDLGITVIEPMPIAEFPGSFGWGYDGVFMFAPTRLYGSPDDFRAFVDKAHELKLSVILDVVYNHFGPDGSVLRRFAKDYFNRSNDNEWGDGLNFDGERSHGMRDYVTANAAHWIAEYHLDGLRLDATQSIHDHRSPEHVIAAIGRGARTAAGDRSIVLIAENETQDTRLVRPLDEGGLGLDGLWNDDFHHSAVVAMTGKSEAYYSDHRGTPQELISAVKHGYLFQGQRYAWQKQPRGSMARGLDPAAFVNFLENHDQVANSGTGDRMHAKTTGGRLRALTALTLLAPGTPMLFQGQEFGSSAPFLFFADHRPELAEAVLKGRTEFLAQFVTLASREMRGRFAVPHDPKTFERCKLDWGERETHAAAYSLHRDLLLLRRAEVAFRQQAAGAVDGAVIGEEAFVLRFTTPDLDDERLLIVNLGPDLVTGSIAEPLVAPPAGHRWNERWSSEHPDYGGTGTPRVAGDDGWCIPGHAAVVLAAEVYPHASQ